MLNIEELERLTKFTPKVDFVEERDDYGSCWKLIFLARDTYWEEFQFNYGDTTDDMGDFFKEVYYPLFLDQVVTGLNVKLDDMTINRCCVVSIVDDYGIPYDNFKQKAVSLEAIEDALKYVLNISQMV